MYKNNGVDLKLNELYEILNPQNLVNQIFDFFDLSEFFTK